MKKSLKYVLFVAGMTSLPAMAHIGYGTTNPIGGRDFGTFAGIIGETQTRSNNAATGNFGWIDGTDADWGDSHKLRAYRFHLDNEADVKISFQEQGYNSTNVTTGVITSVPGGLMPGFSLYSGLAHLTPLAADHDFAVGTVAIRDAVGGGGMTEGAFRALTTWSITNDNNDPASVFTYIGSAYDGSSNYGTGIIPGGDGTLDHMVTKTFHLMAGDYSIFAGGADYADQTVALNHTYGVTGTVAVVPEPETYAMFMAGLGLLAAIGRRRKSRRDL